jgi:hypothetical protein
MHAIIPAASYCFKKIEIHPRIRTKTMKGFVKFLNSRKYQEGGFSWAIEL